MDMTSPLLEGESLGRRHPRADRWLIEGIRLSLSGGQRLAIVGPSGAGKTVLLRCLALLDPLDRGELLWRGRPIRCPEIPQYRSEVLYVHQRPALLEGTVRESLELPYGLKIHRGRRFDPERVVELLEGVGREAAFLEKRVRELSGGEQQIVALIRAVQLDPTVLLLDEPTASLDPQAARGVEQLVLRWFEAGEGSRAMVWVSHDEAQTRRVARTFLAIRGGTMAQADGGPPAGAPEAGPAPAETPPVEWP